MSTQTNSEKRPRSESPEPSLTQDTLTKLHHQLYIYRSPSTTASKSKSPPLNTISGLTTAPRVILLLGWMDAPLRLLIKYAQPYTKFFPHATILIQLSNGQTYLQGNKASSLKILADTIRSEGNREQNRDAMRREMQEVEARQKELRLDEDVKRELEDSTVSIISKSQEFSSSHQQDTHTSSSSSSLKIQPAPSGMIIHTFSDGGSSNLHYLLSDLSSNPSQLHIRGTIFDSCPSAGTPIPGATAFTLPLLKSHWWIVRNILRSVVRASLVVYLYALSVFRKALGRKSRHEVFRASLNAPKSWNSHTIPPRLYLYSKADALVPYKAVEAHARAAPGGQDAHPFDVDTDADPKKSSAPCTVQLRRWTDAPHCSMARVDPDRYWHHVADFLRTLKA